MGRIVIAAYRPKPGKADTLRSLMQNHVPILREQGLVTDRESILMEAEDGTIVEVFEWMSKEAIAAAHENAAVQAMWGEYAEACDYIPAGEVAEVQNLFSEFAALD